MKKEMVTTPYQRLKSSCKMKDVDSACPLWSGVAGEVCHLWEFKDPQRTLQCTGHRRWLAGPHGSGSGDQGA